MTRDELKQAHKAKMLLQGKRRGKKPHFGTEALAELRERFLNDDAATFDSLATEHGVSVNTIRNAIFGEGAYEGTLTEA